VATALAALTGKPHRRIDIAQAGAGSWMVFSDPGGNESRWLAASRSGGAREIRRTPAAGGGTPSPRGAALSILRELGHILTGTECTLPLSYRCSILAR
jgi:hypothetical protein